MSLTPVENQGTGCICGAMCYEDHRADCQYLAAMRAQAYPQVLDDNGLPWYQNTIKRLEEENKRLHAVVLLAARWFKLNFDDDTLSDHPPSKADLAGMFDAMQEARLHNATKGRDNGEEA